MALKRSPEWWLVCLKHTSCAQDVRAQGSNLAPCSPTSCGQPNYLELLEVDLAVVTGVVGLEEGLDDVLIPVPVAHVLSELGHLGVGQGAVGIPVHVPAWAAQAAGGQQAAVRKGGGGRLPCPAALPGGHHDALEDNAKQRVANVCPVFLGLLPTRANQTRPTWGGGFGGQRQWWGSAGRGGCLTSACGGRSGAGKHGHRAENKPPMSGPGDASQLDTLLVPWRGEEHKRR